MPNYHTERLKSQDAIIANGQTKSNIIDCLGKTLVGLELPLAFTGATITFEVSFDGSTFKVLYSSAGIKVEPTIVVNTFMGLSKADFQGVRYFKIVSASAEGAERTIKCILRGD